MKILIISHGHPDLSAGGAERAAYSLFQQLKAQNGVEATFVARVDAARIGHDGWFGAFRSRSDEFLWAPPAFDWFRMTSLSPDDLRRQVETICAQFKPDIVHLHHYFFFGLEALGYFKSSSSAKIVLTLHEYGLICAHNGQMVKRGSLRLCYASSPSECATCFPEYSSGKFFLRQRLAMRLLEAVDCFISPSEFLRNRYIEWGVKPEKVYVIENVLPPGLGLQVPDRGRKAPRKSAKKLRFGYFGQINPFKGTNVLLDAFLQLPEDALELVELIIFGANLEDQSIEFKQTLAEKLNASSRSVSLFGPYRNEDVGDLMRSVDWMVIPSIWWENSPVVIQEAKAAGVPILASNIGGMAEKVKDGIDGVHFLAGNSLDLSSKIEQIARHEIELEVPPADLAQSRTVATTAHINIYKA